MHTTPNDKKRVLLLVTKSNFGGAQKYVFDLARSIPRDRFDVTVAAGGHGDLFTKCENENIRHIRLSHLDRDISIFKEFKAFFALIRILQKEKPDVVHLNSPKMGGIGGVAARITGVPQIMYTNHGWSFHEDRPYWQKICIKIFSWFIVLISKRTIVLSHKEYNDVAHWPLIQSKLTIIPLGITPPTFLEKTEARKALFEKAGIQDEGQELLFSIGELTKNKGYLYAIDALKRYTKPYTYLIAGNGELKEELLKNIHDGGLSKHIILLDFVPEASRYMKAADVFLLPSIKEGLPYVLLEAGFARISVVSTDVGGISDLAHEQKHNLVPAKNPSALLDAIEHKKYIIFSELHLENMLTKTLEHYT